MTAFRARWADILTALAAGTRRFDVVRHAETLVWVFRAMDVNDDARPHELRAILKRHEGRIGALDRSLAARIALDAFALAHGGPVSTRQRAMARDLAHGTADVATEVRIHLERVGRPPDVAPGTAAATDAPEAVTHAFAWKRHHDPTGTVRKGFATTVVTTLPPSDAPVAVRLRTPSGKLDVRRHGDAWLRPLLAPDGWEPVRAHELPELLSGAEAWRDDPFAVRPGPDASAFSVHEAAEPHDDALRGDARAVSVAADAAAKRAGGLVVVDGVVHRRTGTPSLDAWQTFPGSGTLEPFWRLEGDLRSDDVQAVAPCPSRHLGEGLFRRTRTAEGAAFPVTAVDDMCEVVRRWGAFMRERDDRVVDRKWSHERVREFEVEARAAVEVVRPDLVPAPHGPDGSDLSTCLHLARGVADRTLSRSNGAGKARASAERLRVAADALGLTTAALAESGRDEARAALPGMGRVHAFAEPDLHEDHLLAWACLAHARAVLRDRTAPEPVDEELSTFAP